VNGADDDGCWSCWTPLVEDGHRGQAADFYDEVRSSWPAGVLDDLGLDHLRRLHGPGFRTPNPGRSRSSEPCGAVVTTPQDWFVGKLAELRAAAGSPTQAQLLKIAAGANLDLKRATLSDFLAGDFVKLPPWERVVAYATACVGAARENRISLRLEDVLVGLRGHHHTLAMQLETYVPEAGAERPKEEVPARRLFGAVPVRAGAFQHRAVAARLVQAMNAGDAAVLTGAGITPTSVLTGLGGVGKTQIAADHAHTQWDTGKVDLLVWVSARSRAAVLAAYAEVAADLLGQDPAMPEQACRRLLAWLAETTRKWLVVLDDVQHPDHLIGLWPPQTAVGQIVLTTRRRDASLHGYRRQIVDVDLYTPLEALAYLVEKLPARSRTEKETAELEALAEVLGYLPLALAQAAAYLFNKPLLSCGEYRARITEGRTKLREFLPRRQDLPDEHDRLVAATWAVSIDAADKLEPAGVARLVLELVALLDPAGIPLAAVTTEAVTSYLTEHLGRTVTVDDVEAGLESLHRFSVLTLDPDEPQRAIRVHALVQRAVIDAVAQPLGDLARTAADALLLLWPEIDVEKELTRSLLSNAEALQDSAGERLWPSSRHALLYRAARSLGESGLLDSAISAATHLYDEARVKLGNDPAGAAAVFEKILADDLRLLGMDHPETLTARSNLARWRGEAGDPGRAVVETEALLTDRLRVLGGDHPDTLITRGNLARWRGEAGDPAGAIAAVEELLADRIRVLGPDHPDTLATRGNLAYWRGRAGNYDSAVTEFQTLVADQLQILGPDHPDTLTARANLAYWQGRARDYDTAVSETEEVLADRVRVLGPDHPDTLVARGNLAHWRGRAGDPDTAVAEFQALVADQLRILGADHPATLTARANLAHWRGHAGHPAAAVAGFEDLVADQLRVLGADHPASLAARANLAHWLAQAGDSVAGVAGFPTEAADRHSIPKSDRSATYDVCSRHDSWKDE